MAAGHVAAGCRYRSARAPGCFEVVSVYRSTRRSGHARGVTSAPPPSGDPTERLPPSVGGRPNGGQTVQNGRPVGSPSHVTRRSGQTRSPVQPQSGSTRSAGQRRRADHQCRGERRRDERHRHQRRRHHGAASAGVLTRRLVHRALVPAGHRAGAGRAAQGPAPLAQDRAAGRWARPGATRCSASARRPRSGARCPPRRCCWRCSA